MKKSQQHELGKKIGDLNTYCGFTDFILNDGPARGVRGFDIKNGRNLRLTVLADRGLDIEQLTYKGITMSYAAKPGVRSPYLYQEEGVRGFLQQFHAGMLTTCGLTYAGGPGEDQGRQLGLHGPYSNIPAARVNAALQYEGDEAVIELAGDVRESCMFFENVVLHRTMRVETERDVIHLRDVVENQAYEKTPLMLIYHINFGYPMLDAGARVYTSAGQVAPRDEIAKANMDKFGLMEEPGVGRPEECFFHTDYRGEGFAMLHNEKLGVAAIVRFDAQALPLLCEWKCMHAGEYALGLEPTTSGVLNRSDARRNGLLTYLEAGESREYNVSIQFTDDAKEIARWMDQAKQPAQTNKNAPIKKK